MRFVLAVGRQLSTDCSLPHFLFVSEDRYHFRQFSKITQSLESVAWLRQGCPSSCYNPRKSAALTFCKILVRFSSDVPLVRVGVFRSMPHRPCRRVWLNNRKINLMPKPRHPRYEMWLEPVREVPLHLRFSHSCKSSILECALLEGVTGQLMCSLVDSARYLAAEQPAGLSGTNLQRV